ncbi:MAG: prepilin-type N-terminal cleavage/methylation domain-containing protein [Alphaproteobacteria bacterium]|nr:prepilin-type N-terminal cleavage/methylation domain-containing protein [Alphaproteobacteria bacterium]
MTHLKNLRHQTLPGFTLVELAIVLMVIGMIAGAVFKGQDLLESAKVRSVVNDFNRFKMAVSLYHETYGALPGDDDKATVHFGADAHDGNGNGIIDGAEVGYFWEDLAKAGQLPSALPPTSKFGGKYSIVHQPDAQSHGHWIQLGKENGNTANGGLLTPKQAKMLKSKMDEGEDAIDPSKGSLKVIDGTNTSGKCIKDGRLDLSVKTPVCVVLAQF